MASLYELSAEYATVLDAYDAAETDEEREELLTMLEIAGEDINDKAEAYAKIIRMKEEEAKAFKAEADRLTKRKQAAENVVARLKAALLDSMKLTGQTEIKTSIGRWRVQSNPLSCEVLDIDKIPQEWHIKVDDKIDKAGLIKHYKMTGEIIPGVEFKQTEGIRFK